MSCRVDEGRAEAIHRTETFAELSGTPVSEPLPGTLRTAVETVVDANDWTVFVTESWVGGGRFEFSGVARPDAGDDPFA